MKKRQFNEYIALGTIAIVDISTKKHPEAEMKIDLDVWLDLLDRGIGRVSIGSTYAQTNFKGNVHNVHKLITPHFKLTVDHENGDPLDNRMSNLRDVTQGENNRNQKIRKSNTSGHSGIREYRGVRGSTWQAFIGDNNNNKTRSYLGTFKSLDKAIAARKAALLNLGYHPLHGAK